MSFVFPTTHLAAETAWNSEFLIPNSEFVSIQSNPQSPESSATNNPPRLPETR